MSGGGKGGDTVVGYRYFFGIHMGLGRGPVDEIIACKVGDSIAWQGSVTDSSSRSINMPDLFGGEKKEGGIVGPFTVMMGEANQDVRGGPVAEILTAGVIPGFRRMVTIYFDGMISAMNPYPKKWAWRVRRATRGWDGPVLAPSLAVIKLGSATPPPPIPDDGGGADDPDEPTNPGGGPPDPTLPGGPGDPDGGSGDGTITMFSRVLSSNQQWDTVSLTYDVEGMVTKDVNGEVSYTGEAFPMTGRKAEWFELRPVSPSESAKYAIRATRMTSANGYVDTGIELSKGQLDTWLPMTENRVFEIQRPGSSEWGAFDEKIAVLQLDMKHIELNEIRASCYLVLRLERVDMTLNSGPIGGVQSGIPYDPPVRDMGNEGEPNVISGDELAAYESMYSLYWRGLPAPRPDYDFDTWLTAQGYQRLRPAEDPDAFAARLAAYDLWYASQVGGDGSSPQPPSDALVSSGQIMAMNPAHIIYECLTNKEWGRGLDRATINLSSFEEAAAALYQEKFGLCLRWNRKDGIDTFIQNVLDHIAAAIYPERDTALLTISLVRGDYVKTDLPLFTTSNGILAISESGSSTSSGAFNEIQVKYRDPVTNEDRIVKAQNLAAIQSAGGAINSSSKEYRGLPTGDLARRVAQRDLRANAQGIRRFKVVMDRRGWKIRPGGVFRIEDQSRLIPDMVLRVAHVEDGTLLDGKITITAVQDVFSLPSTTFTGSEPPRWTPQNSNACVGRHEVFEAPYFLLARLMPAADFAAVTDTSAYLGTLVEQGQPSNVSYDIAVRDSAPGPDDVPTSGSYCGYIPPMP